MEKIKNESKDEILKNITTNDKIIILDKEIEPADFSYSIDK